MDVEMLLSRDQTGHWNQHFGLGLDLGFGLGPSLDLETEVFGSVSRPDLQNTLR